MHSLKETTLCLAGSCGAFALCRRLFRNRIRILAYHGVDEFDDPVVNFDGAQVGPAVFREHLGILAEHFLVIPLAHAVQAVRGEGSVPPNAVAITFDDGYRNNLQVAAPILKEFGFPAAFFITTGFIDGSAEPWWYRLRVALGRTSARLLPLPRGRQIDLRRPRARIAAAIAWEQELKALTASERAARIAALLETCGADARSPYPLMCWDDVRSLHGMGFDIGPHTVTHVSLAREEHGLVERELVESTRRLREMAGACLDVYSYPFGRSRDNSGEAARVLKELGYIGAVTTIRGMNRCGDDPWALRRLSVGRRHGRAAFESLVSGLTTLLR